MTTGNFCKQIWDLTRMTSMIEDIAEDLTEPDNQRVPKEALTKLKQLIVKASALLAKAQPPPKKPLVK